jgi:hypothetical protein
MPTKENGHIFDFDTDACTRCGMYKEAYEDGGKPRCTDRKIEPTDEGTGRHFTHPKPE